MKFNFVAFDLDGTLYPDYRIHSRLIPFAIKEHRLLRAMGKARKQLRYVGGYEEDKDFYDLQAGLMGEILGEPMEKVKEKTERLIYRGWEPYFKKIKLFPHVIETLDVFRQKGIKMGLLSDFPPETKLKYLKLAEYWDVVLCTEQVGRLKPDTAPFFELASKMGQTPENILYVGNRLSYDVYGAQKAGMKAALIHSRWKKQPTMTTNSKETGSPEKVLADFTFYDYRQLRDYVLG